MAVTNRGGPPFARRFTVTAAGAITKVGQATSATQGGKYDLPSPTSWMRFKASDQPLRVYFNAADYAADENYALVAVGEVMEAPMECAAIWMKGESGTSTVDILGISKV